MTEMLQVKLEGPWERLHRGESGVLAALLNSSEAEAVRQRLAQRFSTASALPAWMPGTSGPEGARFAPPNTAGVLFLGDGIETCLAEVAYHFGRLCAASLGTPPGTRGTFRRLRFVVNGTFADTTGKAPAGVHSRVDYSASWGFARQARVANLAGVHYRSARRRGGVCLAVFDHRTVEFKNVEFGAVVMEWDGSAVQRIA